MDESGYRQLYAYCRGSTPRAITHRSIDVELVEQDLAYVLGDGLRLVDECSEDVGHVVCECAWEVVSDEVEELLEHARHERGLPPAELLLVLLGVEHEDHTLAGGHALDQIVVLLVELVLGRVDRSPTPGGRRAGGGQLLGEQGEDEGEDVLDEVWVDC